MFAFIDGKKTMSLSFFFFLAQLLQTRFSAISCHSTAQVSRGDDELAIAEERCNAPEATGKRKQEPEERARVPILRAKVVSSPDVEEGEGNVHTDTERSAIITVSVCVCVYMYVYTCRDRMKKS